MEINEDTTDKNSGEWIANLDVGKKLTVFSSGRYWSCYVTECFYSQNKEPSDSREAMIFLSLEGHRV